MGTKRPQAERDLTRRVRDVLTAFLTVCEERLDNTQSLVRIDEVMAQRAAAAALACLTADDHLGADVDFMIDGLVARVTGEATSLRSVDIPRA